MWMKFIRRRQRDARHGNEAAKRDLRMIRSWKLGSIGPLVPGDWRARPLELARDCYILDEMMFGRTMAAALHGHRTGSIRSHTPTGQ